MRLDCLTGTGKKLRILGLMHVDDPSGKDVLTGSNWKLCQETDPVGSEHWRSPNLIESRGLSSLSSLK
jgi:hypothetical protein